MLRVFHSGIRAHFSSIYPHCFTFVKLFGHYRCRGQFFYRFALQIQKSNECTRK